MGESDTINSVKKIFFLFDSKKTMLQLTSSSVVFYFKISSEYLNTTFFSGHCRNRLSNAVFRI